jgi:AcrR family transcriptional regulator
MRMNVDGGALVAKQATADKRQRRERGSINPDDIIKGAFELAEQVGIDNVSMPLLGRHLGVGVTSIYWYFRKKDDLLNAMTDRAVHTYVLATPYIEADGWRETLRNHAWAMRKTFIGNPILCDLILIRSALSPKAAQLGQLEVEKAIAGLVEAGLSAEDALENYSAVSVHVRGSVVLQRLYQKNLTSTDGVGAQLDDTNFEYALNCLLDHAERLIESGGAKKSKAANPAARQRNKTAAAS